MKKIAIFASGNGSNFEAIAKQANGFEIAFLFCDRKDAFVFERAKKLGIPTRYASIIKEKENYEKVVMSFLEEFDVDLIVLAGYMKLIGKDLLSKWEGKIINIHPSLLPKYPGTHSIEKAWENRDSEIGITIHYVDQGMDTGRIIEQHAIKLNPNWDLVETEKQVHKLEHEYYPKVIAKLLGEK